MVDSVRKTPTGATQVATVPASTPPTGTSTGLPDAQTITDIQQDVWQAARRYGTGTGSGSGGGGIDPGF